MIAAFFGGLAAVCAIAAAGLVFATLVIVTAQRTTNWQAAAIVAWCLVGVLVLGALFGIAALSVDQDAP